MIREIKKEYYEEHRARNEVEIKVRRVNCRKKGIKEHLSRGYKSASLDVKKKNCWNKSLCAKPSCS